MTADRAVSSRVRKRWFDPRFVLGLMLIAVSILGVWFVITAARQTSPMFIAVRTIMPGEAVTDADLRVVEVALGPLDSYLAPEGLPLEPVALRTIEAGELIARTALGSAAQAVTTTVVLTSSVGLPQSVVSGTPVELWEAPARGDGTFDEPRILVADAFVSDIVDDDSVIAVRGSAVELIIPRSAVADVLSARARDSQLSVIPVTGSRP